MENATENNISNCNGLDFHLKQILNKEPSIKCLGCRCHKGVSNFVIPFRFNDLDPTFYIFIGQFLFKPVSGQFLEIFKKLEDLQFVFSGDSRLTGRERYVKPDPFVTQQDVQSFNVKDPEGKSKIAYVDFKEYVAYKRYIVKQFSDWISNYYEEVELIHGVRSVLCFLKKTETRKSMRPNEFLRSFMAYESIDSILYHLEYAKNIESRVFNELNDKILNELTEFVKDNKSLLSNNQVKDLKEYSLCYNDAGIINSIEFSEMGKKLLNKLKNEEV